MRFNWKKSAILASALLGTGLMAEAQTNTPINIVTTATPFLRISPDARAGAMGEAGIALSPDANATFWNNAKVPFATSNGQIGVTYTPWLKDVASDVYLVTLGGFYKIDDQQAISGGVRYFNLGSIQFADETGQLQGSSNPKEFSVEFGYSRILSEQFGIGLTARYINSSLGNGTEDNDMKSGSAFAVDLSGYYNGLDEAGQGLTAGLTLSNLGTKISYTNDPDAKQFIPANLGLGGAYHAVLDEDNKLTFALDVNHMLVPKTPDLIGTEDVDQQQLADYYNTGVFESWGKSFSNSAYSGSLGAEYGYNDQFFLRAGYYLESAGAGDRHYFTAGAGIKYNVINFNFAYLAPSGSSVNRNPLSNTLRFSLVFDLGQTKNY